MKDIKFRAWHKADKKMYEVYGFSQNKWFLRGKNFPMPLGAIELMQYTGLKDKEDIEIYEGDVLFDEHCDVYGVVIFEEGKFLCETETYSDDLWEVCDYMVVIGNIYDNHELIK